MQLQYQVLKEWRVISWSLDCRILKVSRVDEKLNSLR